MALQCDNELKRLVPLRRVVRAAVADLHEDLGTVEQVLSHFAARGLAKLDRETLKSTGKKIIIPINSNTNNAVLPIDFEQEIGVYVIINGRKVPLSLRPNLVDEENIEIAQCVDKCERCGQSASICNDLTITETIESVLVNDQTSPPQYADKTVIKRLYPNGDYFLETTTPVWDFETDTVAYSTKKEFITAIDLKPCGCIEESASNIEKIKTCCPDVWCCYFAPCDSVCNPGIGGYKIFEDSGLLKLDNPGKITQIYLEYYGFLAKRNGQWMVPAVAFETLVEWIKHKWTWNKRNLPRWERLDQQNKYKEERGSMEKVLGMISLSLIMEAALSTPKFDMAYHPLNYCYHGR